MKVATDMNGTLDGREAQFEEMMDQLSAMQAKYRGVRGELLAKVREEFMRLKPTRAPAARPAPLLKLAPDKVLPSCRTCGRGMKVSDVDASLLVCERGHTRQAT